MRSRFIGALVFLAACATGSVERQRLADGSWHLTCRLPMDECLRHFEQVCMDKRYRILSGRSQRDVRDVDPGTREYRTSEITALCDRDAAEMAASAPAPSASAAAPAASAVAPAAAASASAPAPAASAPVAKPAGMDGGF